MEWNGCQRAMPLTPPTFSLRKEVIQPQVLLRLPCYDLVQVTGLTVGAVLLPKQVRPTT